MKLQPIRISQIKFLMLSIAVVMSMGEIWRWTTNQNLRRMYLQRDIRLPLVSSMNPALALCLHAVKWTETEGTNDLIKESKLVSSTDKLHQQRWKAVTSWD